MEWKKIVRVDLTRGNDEGNGINRRNFLPPLPLPRRLKTRPPNIILPQRRPPLPPLSANQPLPPPPLNRFVAISSLKSRLQNTLTNSRKNVSINLLTPPKNDKNEPEIESKLSGEKPSNSSPKMNIKINKPIVTTLLPKKLKVNTKKIISLSQTTKTKKTPPKNIQKMYFSQEKEKKKSKNEICVTKMITIKIPKNEKCPIIDCGEYFTKKKTSKQSSHSSETIADDFYDMNDPFINDTEIVSADPELIPEIEGFYIYKGEGVPMTKNKTNEKRAKILPLELDFALFCLKNNFSLDLKEKNDFDKNIIGHLKKVLPKYKNYKDCVIIQEILKEEFGDKNLLYLFDSKNTNNKIQNYKKEIIKMFKKWKKSILCTEKTRTLRLVQKMQRETDHNLSQIAKAISLDIEISKMDRLTTEKEFFHNKTENSVMEKINEMIRFKEYSVEEFEEIYGKRHTKMRNFDSVLKGFGIDLNDLNGLKKMIRLKIVNAVNNKISNK